MIRVVDVRGVPLTKEVAIRHRDLTPMRGERAVKETRLKFLKGLFDQGLFSAPSWHVGRCLADDILYRLDGQHSSVMLAGLEDEEIPPGLLAQMITWEFTSMEDAADLFNSFNNPRSARTNEDVMGVYQAAVPSLAHLSRKFLVDVSNGIHDREAQKWDDGAEDALPPYGPRERGSYFRFEPCVTAALWLSRFVGTKNQAFLGHPTIVSEMLRQWEASEVLATTFWDYVLRESHPEADHETRELAETYREWAIKRRQRQPQYRAKAAKAWKTFVKGNPEVDVPATELPTDDLTTSATL